jgi:hypothetical protein
MLTQDLRDAWRGPRRTPVVAITAILTVALGVGASTAVFSVVQAVLLRPLPYPMRTSWSSCSKPISRHPRESRRLTTSRGQSASGALRRSRRLAATAVAAGQIVLPLAIDPTNENRANHTLRVVGRLRPGVTLEQARAEMRTVSAGLAREFPATNMNWSARVETLADTTLEPQVSRSLLLVLGAVTMVFLIACANVANLMLARGTRRQAEIAHPLLRNLLPATLPRRDELQLDASVLAFGLLLSLLSGGVVFGVVPG